MDITSNARLEMARLNQGLRLYAQLARKTMDEVLDKKGRDLGIQLYRGFRAVRWKGKSIAYREFRRRVKSGQGTRVRTREISEKWKSKIPLTQNVTKRGIRRGRVATDTYPTSPWQRAVAQELLRRQAGQGALAASFLWMRRRSSQARGVVYVRNKTGRPIGYAERGAEHFRIVSLQPGADIIDRRYGIVARAAAAVTADMAPYIARKQQEAMRRALASTGLRTAA